MDSIPKTISVVSYKGGVGKTTTAIHLAAYLRSLHNTVLIVDADLNQSALDWYHSANPHQLPFIVVSLDEWHKIILPGKGRRGSSYMACNYFVVDTPARPSVEEMKDLAQSHCLIIPVTPDALSIRAAFKMLKDIQKLSQSQTPLNYRMLLNRLPPPPSTAGDEAKLTLEQAKVNLLPGGIRRFAALEKAALQGITVDQVKGDKNAGVAWSCYTTAFDALKIPKLRPYGKP